MYPIPAALLSIGSYLAAPLLFSRCKPQRRPLLSPLNWFFVLFGFQLVVTPVVVAFYGPYIALLPAAPSPLAVNLALVLYSAGYWAFCAGVHLFRRSHRVLASSTFSSGADSWLPPKWMIVLYFVLGSVGVMAFFGNRARLLLYFLNPQEYLSTIESGNGVTSLMEAASTFLRAFFPFGLLMMWCRVTLSPGRFSRVWAATLLALIALASPIYSYERSSLVVPMLSIGAVYTKRKSRANKWGLIALLTLMVGAAALLTVARANPDLPGAGETPSAVELYQGYAMSPQYLGFLLQRTHYGRQPMLGRITLASIITPVPVLGKPFRDNAGTAIFGQFTGRDDLPCPFIGELFLDFSVLGVAFGFLLVGLVVARLQEAFELAREPLHIFILQFSAIWFSYVVASDIAVVSLAALYLMWPVYLFLFYRWIARARQRSATRLIKLDRGAESQGV